MSNHFFQIQTNVQRLPIVLVHGFIDKAYIFKTLKTNLEHFGYQVYAPNLSPNDGRIGIDQLAEQLKEFINTTFTTNQKISIIGFSMGGLISRYYIQRLGGLEKVQHLITIATPHHGTVTAFALPLPGIRQMRPNSQFLQNLNQDIKEQLTQLTFASLWTPYDLMIIPAHSSQMPIGFNQQIPVLTHIETIKNQNYLTTILNLLTQKERRSSK